MKRIFDIVFSIGVIALMWIFFILIAMLVSMTSSGGIFYVQERVGANRKIFRLYKFRTMTVDADKQGQLTVGKNDVRITGVGKILRKFKLDEFPQLINVLKGEMSIVGPRPEVLKYVEMYSPEQLNVLKVRPGLTDYASIEYINENEILGKSSDPEKSYIDEIMPAKLQLNLKYIREKSFITDLKIIFRTIGRIFS